MKFYVAGSFTRKEEVKEVYKLLRSRGHEVISDWTLHKNIKPYKDNVDLAAEFAIEDVDGARNCDVFVLLSEDRNSTSRGVYVELGAAIVSQLATGKPEIYVVGDHVSELVFYFHPAVKRRQSLDLVLEEIRSKKL